MGAGPIGLAALMTAQFYTPASVIMIDPDPNRLEVSRGLGATATVSVTGAAAGERVKALTDGAGVDVAIEAVGVPGSFDLCQDIVAPGGHVANVGVHGRSVELHLERLWAHGRLDAKRLVTHRFGLDEMMKADDTFTNAAKEKALKVAIKR